MTSADSLLLFTALVSPQNANQFKARREAAETEARRGARGASSLSAGDANVSSLSDEAARRSERIGGRSRAAN